MPDKISKEDLLLEKEQLELEELRERSAKARAERQMLADARKDRELALGESREKDKNLAARCNHKKGGRDYASVRKEGDGENFAVTKHTMPLGDTIVLCRHCLFVWKPGTTAEKCPDGTRNPTGINYQTALRFPTDDSPSGSVIFGQRATAIAA